MRLFTYFIFILFIAGSPLSFGQETVFKYYSPKKNKYVEYAVRIFDSKRISNNCLKKGKPSCEAWKALSGKKKKEIRRAEMPVVGHPAALRCAELGGENRIIKDRQERHYDMCFFEDDSAIDSWDLYNAKK